MLIFMMWTMGTLQQYEINGGINLNFPIFDSDFVENDIRSLQSHKKISLS